MLRPCGPLVRLASVNTLFCVCQNVYEIFYPLPGQLPWDDAAINPWKVAVCPLPPVILPRNGSAPAGGTAASHHHHGSSRPRREASAGRQQGGN